MRDIAKLGRSWDNYLSSGTALAERVFYYGGNGYTFLLAEFPDEMPTAEPKTALDMTLSEIRR